MSRSRALQEHFDKVAALGCIVCLLAKNIQVAPQLHHAKGGSMKLRGVHKAMSQKTSDWLVLPLCPHHHVDGEGIHKLGVETWEERFDKQDFYLDVIARYLETDVWALALAETPTRSDHRPSKINARVQ